MKRGFTLAELLIALVILGVVATFTIPKVLNSQAGSERNSKAKEVAGMLSEAYTVYKGENTPDNNTSVAHLTPYLNYVRVVTTGLFDGVPGPPGDVDCSGVNIDCYILHSGVIIGFDSTVNFGSAGNKLALGVDPDGYTGNSDSVGFILNKNGRITSYADDPVLSGAGYGDPAWFSWD